MLESEEAWKAKVAVEAKRAESTTTITLEATSSLTLLKAKGETRKNKINISNVEYYKNLLESLLTLKNSSNNSGVAKRISFKLKCLPKVERLC